MSFVALLAAIPLVTFFLNMQIQNNITKKRKRRRRGIVAPRAELGREVNSTLDEFVAEGKERGDWNWFLCLWQ